MKYLLIIFLLLCTSGCDENSTEDFQKGLDAAQSGDHETALKEWRPLAEQGDVIAQFTLGLMYADGEGVVEDDKEAVKWYRLAAEQGFIEAQYSLGNMYAAGEGVIQDDKEAVKW